MFVAWRRHASAANIDAINVKAGIIVARFKTKFQSMHVNRSNHGADEMSSDVVEMHRHDGDDMIA